MWQISASLEGFLSAISADPTVPLVFVQNGRSINSDYHVTEFKSVAVAAIDCGRHEDSWHETVVQILDGPVNKRGSYMAAGTFQKIAEISMKRLPALAKGALIFEFGFENAAMQRLKPEVKSIRAGQISVELHPLKSTCKPQMRWMESEAGSKNANCCSA